MISEAVIGALQGIVPADRIYLKEPMDKHTAFRIGGPADCFIEAGSVEQLKKLQKYLELAGIPYFLLGNGTNLLVSDLGYRGVVLHIGSVMNEIRVMGDTITVQAGALMSQTARAALEHGLTGFEFAAGIPGSIGGGIAMNAGAYGGEMKQVVTAVTVLDKDGNERVLDNDAMEFGYRTSAVRHQPFIVTEAELKLAKGEPDAIRKKMEELAAKRREKQPLEYPSAGSTFKRPDGYFAGELIMKAGLRGFQIGGARVSDKHCGFIVNAGSARAEDVWKLMRGVRRKVQDMFQVTLEPEIILLGEFPADEEKDCC